MYCVKCGVKLENGVNECPLCHTIMNFTSNEVSEFNYPNRYPSKKQNLTLASISTLLFIIAITVILIICFNIYGNLSWGSYVISSLTLFYFIFLFPTWFSKYHPITFISIDFGLLIIFLFIINYLTNGHWWLSFALPLVGIIAIIIITTTIFIKYLKKGGFYIAGGLIVFTSCSCMLIEFFQCLTFGSEMWRWSLYCVAAGSLLGLFFILAGIIKPLGNHLKKTFYI